MGRCAALRSSRCLSLLIPRRASLLWRMASESWQCPGHLGVASGTELDGSDAPAAAPLELIAYLDACAGLQAPSADVLVVDHLPWVSFEDQDDIFGSEEEAPEVSVSLSAPYWTSTASSAGVWQTWSRASVQGHVGSFEEELAAAEELAW